MLIYLAERGVESLLTLPNCPEKWPKVAEAPMHRHLLQSRSSCMSTCVQMWKHHVHSSNIMFCLCFRRNSAGWKNGDELCCSALFLIEKSRMLMYCAKGHWTQFSGWMPGKVLFVNRTLIIIFDWLSYNYMCNDLEKKNLSFSRMLSDLLRKWKRRILLVCKLLIENMLIESPS